MGLKNESGGGGKISSGWNSRSAFKLVLGGFRGL